LKIRLELVLQGRIQDFKLGGGGAALKKIAPSGGRRIIFWGILCEKSRFYTKKSSFFQLRREARKFLGYFVWKITILRQKIIFFQILGGARAGCAPLWIRPLYCMLYPRTKGPVMGLDGSQPQNRPSGKQYENQTK
jgi:hypothetical protein